MNEEVPISCSWKDPDEEDIEKLCFDAELDKQDSNQAGPICAPRQKEATDTMRCPQRNSDMRLAGFAFQKGADDGESNVLADLDEEEKDLNDSQNQLCQTEALKIPISKPQVTDPFKVQDTERFADMNLSGFAFQKGANDGESNVSADLDEKEKEVHDAPER